MTQNLQFNYNPTLVSRYRKKHRKYDKKYAKNLLYPKEFRLQTTLLEYKKAECSFVRVAYGHGTSINTLVHRKDKNYLNHSAMKKDKLISMRVTVTKI